MTDATHVSPPHTGPQLAARNAWLMCGSVMALFATVMLQIYWNTWAIDLAALYIAAAGLAQGIPEAVYDSEPIFWAATGPITTALTDSYGVAGAKSSSYVYPPLWAHLLAPLTNHIAPLAFFNAFLVIHMALLWGGFFLLWRSFCNATPTFASAGILALAVLGTEPFVALFLYNQPQMILVCLVITSMLFYTRGWMIAAGLCIGLAAAIKITPAVFALIFLADRNYRAFAAATLSGLALLALSIAVAGMDMHWAFLSQLDRFGQYALIWHNNLSLEAFITSLIATPATGLISSESSYAVAPMIPALRVAGHAALVAAIALVLWRTRNHTLLARTVLRMLGLWCALILLSSTGWSHYMIAPLMLLPILVMPTLAAQIGRTRVWVASTIALLCNSHLISFGLVAKPDPFSWPVAFGILSLFALLWLAMSKPHHKAL
ncbi:glycosyltransferase family 87 protein [Nereida sp. MMG025]|uniref:glycosyltransferase family 87 protein n=1 Tax=Nereida sp. MMG025 TaxID=2909981 RepID=UPI001F452522|nr:glycosyltransferase family 87 protein [Nereida sp. MMG025]MCF6444066.1 DUF2029 domain-containing protein [Nereida sp. MMG025]